MSEGNKERAWDQVRPSALASGIATACFKIYEATNWKELIVSSVKKIKTKTKSKKPGRVLWGGMRKLSFSWIRREWEPVLLLALGSPNPMWHMFREQLCQMGKFVSMRGSVACQLRYQPQCSHQARSELQCLQVTACSLLWVNSPRGTVDRSGRACCGCVG